MSFGLARGKTLDITGFGIESDDLSTTDVAPLIDVREWFGDRATLPLHIEIGSGKGTFLVQQAPRQPEVNFLGIEWAGEFFRYAADRLRRNKVINARLLHADAVEFIRHRCPDAICRVIHLYFPDPWPKKRHHKRRGVQDQSLRDYHRILEPASELRIVTDHDDYWQWIQEHAERAAALFKREPFASSTATAGEGELVGTNFERKYRREGRPFNAMTLRRRGGDASAVTGE
jgi:tRNA (guanine-N7-)-methyltransferase